MLSTPPLVIALAALALGGCGGRSSSTDNADAAVAAASRAATPDPKADPYYVDDTMNADEVLRRNDLAIAENKRLNAMIARHQAEDAGKFDRLKSRCEAAVGGLSSDNWRKVDHCIETGW